MSCVPMIATASAIMWPLAISSSAAFSCAEAGLVLVAFDRATLPWHAGQVVRAGESHGGLILFRRSVRSTDYGDQARLVTDFWLREARGWDWTNRIVYLPKSP